MNWPLPERVPAEIPQPLLGSLLRAFTRAVGIVTKEPRPLARLAADVPGLVIAVVVTAASVHENAIGIALLDKVAIDNPSVAKAWVDAGFKNTVTGHGARMDINVETIHRDPWAKGFAPLSKRWIVEQTCGILMLLRLLVWDYETRPASSESMVYWSMTDTTTRQLTGTATMSWRGG